jgi:hypothetical protein
MSIVPAEEASRRLRADHAAIHLDQLLLAVQ